MVPDYEQHAGTPFCKACFMKNFMKGGARGVALEGEFSGLSLSEPSATGGSELKSPSGARPAPSPVPPGGAAKAAGGAKAAGKFAFLGGGAKCPSCLKTVYKMEEVRVGEGEAQREGCACACADDAVRVGSCVFPTRFLPCLFRLSINPSHPSIHSSISTPVYLSIHQSLTHAPLPQCDPSPTSFSVQVVAGGASWHKDCFSCGKLPGGGSSENG